VTNEMLFFQKDHRALGPIGPDSGGCIELQQC